MSEEKKSTFVPENPSQVVFVRNNSEEPFTDMYNGEEFTIEPGETEAHQWFKVENWLAHLAFRKQEGVLEVFEESPEAAELAAARAELAALKAEKAKVEAEVESETESTKEDVESEEEVVLTPAQKRAATMAAKKAAEAAK